MHPKFHLKDQGSPIYGGHGMAVPFRLTPHFMAARAQNEWLSTLRVAIQISVNIFVNVLFVCLKLFRVIISSSTIILIKCNFPTDKIQTGAINLPKPAPRDMIKETSHLICGLCPLLLLT